MPVPRRDFMKLLGISLGSLLLARCQRTGTPEPTILTCYATVSDSPVPGTPTMKSLSARDRLRLCWMRFGELAQKARDAKSGGAGQLENTLVKPMIADHQNILNELVSGGEITGPVADLIQEAYAAAVNHIWSVSLPVTCYTVVPVNYTPASADNLVHQSEVLTQVAAGTPIAPETMEKARAAIEHDLAFYALTDAEVQALYSQLLAEIQESGGRPPSFEDVELTLTPDVRSAADFLVEVLMGKG